MEINLLWYSFMVFRIMACAGHPVGTVPRNSELASRFAEIYRQISASDKHTVVKETVAQQVKAVESEVAKGGRADAPKIEGWLKVLARMMPDILEVTVNALINPISGVATAVRKVAEKAKSEAGRS